MKRFIEGDDRNQSMLLPECLEDYASEDNPVRVIDVFVDELKLEKVGSEGTLPAATGRPAYHPATLLKLYLYGYLNRIQSSRRLEREAQRNLELMWLMRRLAPDFKTIADDGSKFKAVNNRDKNFTSAKMQRRMAQIEENIERYLAAMDTADRSEPEVAQLKKARLQDKISALKAQMQQLKATEARMLASPDQPLSFVNRSRCALHEEPGWRHRGL